MPLPSLYIITGGSRGLGAALVRLAADDGETVISVSRTAPPLGEHLPCDLADPEAAATAVNSMLRERAGDGFDAYVLINNAGTIQPIGTSYGAADVVHSLSVNLAAHIAITHVFVEALSAITSRKLVVNISSGAAVKPYHGWILYCAAKAGLEHFGRVLALEQSSAEAPVDVVNVNPGIIDTGMQAEIRATTRECFPQLDRFTAFHANGDLAPANDVASKLIAGIRSGRTYNGRTVGLEELSNVV